MAVTFAVLLPTSASRRHGVHAHPPRRRSVRLAAGEPGLEITWPLVHQLVVMTGGIMEPARRSDTDAVGRRLRAMRPSAERRAKRPWAARWGRRAVAVAVAIPLLYVATRWGWALGIPLGLTADDLRAYAGNQWLGGVLLATVAALGALLTTGLVRSWGEVVPGWVPVIGLRRIPPGLAIVPAALMAIVITSAGLAFMRTVLVRELPFGLDEWGVIGPTLLWPIWGVALGVATLAYFYRRRGRCRTCGLGGTAREQVSDTTLDSIAGPD
jgi:hypothetical protein